MYYINLQKISLAFTFHSYETGNGIAAQEAGYVKNLGQEDNEIQVAEGSYSYTDPEGTPVQVSYIADEYGFQPQGSHIHPAIIRAIELIRSLPVEPEK